MNKLEKDFLVKFNSNYGDKWEYIGGYINRESKIKIKCKECGEIKTIRADRCRKNKTINIKCKVWEEKRLNELLYIINGDRFEYKKKKDNII